MKFLSFAANKILGSSILPMADSTNNTSIKGNTMLTDVLSLLSSGVILAGGIMVVWGCINIGRSIKNHQGADMETGILTAVGGAIIAIAGTWFKTI